MTREEFRKSLQKINQEWIEKHKDPQMICYKNALEGMYRAYNILREQYKDPSVEGELRTYEQEIRDALERISRILEAKA